MNLDKLLPEMYDKLDFDLVCWEKGYGFHLYSSGKKEDDMTCIFNGVLNEEQLNRFKEFLESLQE